MCRTWAARTRLQGPAATPPASASTACRTPRANWREGVTRDGVEYGYTRLGAGSSTPTSSSGTLARRGLAWSDIDPARRRPARACAECRRPCSVRTGLIGHMQKFSGRSGAPGCAPFLVQPDRSGVGRLDGHDPAAVRWPGPGPRWPTALPTTPASVWPGGPARRCAACTPGSTGSAPTGTACSASSSRTKSAWTPPRPTTHPRGPRGRPLPAFLHPAALQPARRRFSYRWVVADGGFHAAILLVGAAWALAWEGMAAARGSLAPPGAPCGVTAALVRAPGDLERASTLPSCWGLMGCCGRVATWAGLGAARPSLRLAGRGGWAG